MNYITDFKEKDNNWDSFSLDSKVDIKLEKGLIISLETTKENREKVTENKVIDWSYKILDNSIHTSILLEENKSNLLSMRLDNLDKKKKEIVSVVVALFLIFSLGLLGLIIYSIYNFPEPEYFWSFIGSTIRVGFVIAVVIAAIVTVYLLMSKGTTILRIYLAQVTFVLSIVIPALWWHVSSPPESAATGIDPVSYLYFLSTSLKSLISENIYFIDTISVVGGLLGLGGITKISDLIIKSFTKKGTH